MTQKAVKTVTKRVGRPLEHRSTYITGQLEKKFRIFKSMLRKELGDTTLFCDGSTYIMRVGEKVLITRKRGEIHTLMNSVIYSTVPMDKRLDVEGIK